MINPFSSHILHGPHHYRPSWDLVSVNAAFTNRITEKLESLRDADETSDDTKIEVLLGDPGQGKTHLFGRIEDRLRNDVIFIFVHELNDLNRPLEHIQYHVVESLFQKDKSRQHSYIDLLLSKVCQKSFLEYFNQLPDELANAHRSLGEKIQKDPLACLQIASSVNRLQPFQRLAQSISDTFSDQINHVMRAWALAWSPLREKARRWLRGDSLAAEDLELLGISSENSDLSNRPAPIDVIRGLASLAQHHLPVLLCYDQLERVLEDEDGRTKLVHGLVSLLHEIPNLQLVLSCHKQRWDLFEGEIMFKQRCRATLLEKPDTDNMVELVRRRLLSWSERAGQAEGVWPFDEESMRDVINRKNPTPRGLLATCEKLFEDWLQTDRTEKIYFGDGPRPRVEEAIRQVWQQELAAIKADENRSPKHTQESALNEAMTSLLKLIQDHNELTVPPWNLLSLEESVLQKEDQYACIAKIGKESISHRVLLAVTKIENAASMTAYLRALQALLVKKKSADRAILITHQQELPLGKTKGTVGRKLFDELEEKANLKVFRLVEEIDSFEHLMAFHALLNKFRAGDLLEEHQLDEGLFQKLMIEEIRVLDSIKLLDQLFHIPGQPAAAPAAPAKPAAVETPIPVISKPAVASAAPVASKPAAASPTPAETIAQQKPLFVEPGPKPQTLFARETKAPAVAQAVAAPVSAPAQDWARNCLQDVVKQLKNFNLDVSAHGVEVGARSARLLVMSHGNTSITRIKNRAEDLKTRVPGISTTPLVESQPEGISLDVELPAEFRRVVRLAELLPHRPGKSDAPLFPVGQDVAGRGHWADLSDSNQPHYLIAGSTGSGKSEFLKAMIAGLARQLSPDDLQFILMDPKRVTFNFQGESPYLRQAPVYSSDEALPLIEWCFEETNHRYEQLQRRRLTSINEWRQTDPATAPPRIVVICDEFPALLADKEKKKRLEAPLEQVGNLARAAGIHLIFAAQRPEANIVTPVLRNCLAGRVCLRVSSAADSRIVLDVTDGADLFGNGDLLWNAGRGIKRLQGVLLAPNELEEVLRLS